MTETSTSGVSSPRALTLIALVLLAITAHWRAVQSGFHLDDFFRASDNPEIGSLEQAVSQYREHLRLDASYAKARLNMAYALRDLGRRDEALAELRILLAMHPTHIDARDLLESLGD